MGYKILGAGNSLPVRILTAIVGDMEPDEAIAVIEMVRGISYNFSTIRELADEMQGHDCKAGAMCAMFETIDAYIYIRVMEPKTAGAYWAADERDFQVMRRSVRAMANYRRVTE